MQTKPRLFTLILGFLLAVEVTGEKGNITASHIYAHVKHIKLHEKFRYSMHLYIKC